MNEMDFENETELAGHFSIPALLKFSAVPILTSLCASVYMLVDGLFIANFTSGDAYAAVILVTPYVMVFPAVGFMVGGGGNALIGKLLGEQKRERAVEVFSMLVEFTVLSALALTVLGEILLEPFLRLNGVEGEVFSQAVIYGRIVLAGTVFLALQYEFQLFLITDGEEVRSFIFTLAAGVVNIALDALLILAAGMGVAGAAIGTAAAQLTGTLLPVLFFLSRRKQPDTLLFLKLTKLEPGPILDSCINGLSEMIENLAENIVGLFYNNRLLAIAGAAGVDAYGSVMYIYMLFSLTFVGFNESVVPVIAYHFGAGNREELRSLLKNCLLVCGGFSMIFFIGVQGLAVWLAGLFAAGSSTLLDMTVTGFRISSFSLLFMGPGMFIPSLFTGLNDGWNSALLTVFELLVFPGAAVWILSALFGLNGIWCAENAAWVLSSLLCTVVLLIHYRRYFGKNMGLPETGGSSDV